MKIIAMVFSSHRSLLTDAERDLVREEWLLKMNLLKTMQDYENSLDSEERRRKLLEFMTEVAIQLDKIEERKEQNATST